MELVTALLLTIQLTLTLSREFREPMALRRSTRLLFFVKAVFYLALLIFVVAIILVRIFDWTHFFLDHRYQWTDFFVVDAIQRSLAHPHTLKAGSAGPVPSGEDGKAEVATGI